MRIGRNYVGLQFCFGLSLLLALQWALPARAQAQGTVPSETLRREVDQIRVDLALATNALENCKEDLSNGYCGTAEQNLIFSYANVELGKAEIPQMRDRVKLVEPRFLHTAQGEKDVLLDLLTQYNSWADKIETNVTGFIPNFEKICPAHPVLDAFQKALAAAQGTNRILLLQGILNAPTGNITPDVFWRLVPFRPDQPGNDNPAHWELIIHQHPGDIEAALQPTTEPIIPEEAAEAVQGLSAWNCDKLRSLHDKYPDNPILLNMLNACLKHSGQPTVPMPGPTAGPTPSLAADPTPGPNPPAIPPSVPIVPGGQYRSLVVGCSILIVLLLLIMIFKRVRGV
jgi:hypothetical protein